MPNALPTIDDPIDAHNIALGRMLQVLYQDMELQIARADTKAQLILSTDAILLAVLTNFGFALEHEGTTFLHPVVAALVIGLNLTMLIMVLVSVYFALKVAFPRHATPVNPASKDVSLYYSAHIKSMPKDVYLKRMMNLPLQGLKQSVIEQIHAKAGIVEKKYKNVRFSMIFALVSLISWVLAEAIVIVTN